ncbi:class I SAM-dependent methyltransferase [Brevibacterium daeguense]|uniref:Class I SAM-dependent methyltransferase n=1 Tax=Brevibacterium daeguense TaxID=909936 RepID=A0ABP8EIA0_9MICO|nr:class I SAM-dependent methyltransferase [Brevibacterium daeguense]
MTAHDLDAAVAQHAQELLMQATATATTAMILVGDRLGLYQALADAGPVTSSRLAEHAGCSERYVREWLAQQTAAGVLAYDPADETFSLPQVRAAVLTDPALVGACMTAGSMFRDLDAVLHAFRSGEGIPWGEHDPMVFAATARFWGGQYRAHLVTEWIPALDGVAEALAAGAKVADVGTGQGAALIILAEAFPRSRFIGFDPHEPSIEAARQQASAAGVADRVAFEVDDSSGYPGRDYDLVTFFDTFHDLGDPVGAAAHALRALAPGGSLLLVEPQAADDLAANLSNPAAPIGYAASTTMCTANSLSQPVGTALGGQAGERRLRAVLGEAGFGEVRRAADSPFNLVLQARR